jgi:hypothetical protein
MASKTKKVFKIQEVQRHWEYALYLAPARKPHNRRLSNLHWSVRKKRKKIRKKIR